MRASPGRQHLSSAARLLPLVLVILLLCAALAGWLS